MPSRRTETLGLDAFDYHLPSDRIALHPARPRDAARLLHVVPAPAGGPPRLADHRVRDLPALLQPGDALVFNDTRVIAAELKGERVRDGRRARVAITLFRREGPAEWRAFARPAKRLKAGDVLHFGQGGSMCGLGRLDARVLARAEGGMGGEVRLAFDLSGPVLDEAIAALGRMPLPPYIAARRQVTGEDARDYQTIFARREGAVAAPTAGLHFTEALFAALERRGIARRFITLHVGPGTFLPVKSDDISQHAMHAEWGEIAPETAEALNGVRRRGGRIVAVGTTVARLLETAARAGGEIAPFSGETDIFIRPGFRFRAVDLLITNFHLPRSTLLMLVAAFSGLETIKAAYAHAMAAGYRFYSYGDACLLEPQPDAGDGDEGGGA